METEEKVAAVFSLYDFSIRAIIDVLAIVILVGLIYYPKHKNKDFIFTFVLFNVINFMICYLLGAAKIKMGFAFGLFAIFSIIKYRTIVVSIKDMGYFFVCVALGMLNSLANSSDGFMIMIVCNVVILILTFFLERLNFINNENVKEIIYDNVRLIKPDVRDELIADLVERTGLEIHKVEIVSINYLKDTVLLKAYYYAKESENMLPTASDND
ncbi:DUF4956 domain-containing protein [Flavobacterium sp.]|uniref:DUF4956 domain-containing protein n=1 Tax=Flavobacterium sp. TaxID=239 RepID=UPI002B4ABFEF|nr:DUF4956 domain-containing protein [Flavobacterium sp.]HLP63548.1 DUF4956 domain-containing protein [Flavobacterium sp.]